MTSNEHGYVKDGAQDNCCLHVAVQTVVHKRLLCATCIWCMRCRIQLYPDEVGFLRCSRPAEQPGQLHP